ncbi:Serine acetyltransferase [Porphyromonas macacae]|uniref:Serine acetyltransferase n=2 Tax=Porphyromonas macacae TaxID=28115 RepID=A0A379E808_9PORP|nr:Serine acetyltransferase [Porphyromonas macacae]
MMEKIAIIGAGGLGREILSLINQINEKKGQYTFIGFFDDGIQKGTFIHGYPILGGIQELNKWEEDLSIAFGIGNAQLKENIYKKVTNTKIKYPTLIHPSVIIQDPNSVKILKGTIICAGTIITCDVVLENFVLINLGCTIGHDAKIKSFCSFMPSVNISGETRIGECVYIGTGAQIINQIDIEDYVTVGAGSVVIENLPKGVTAVGVPAKVIKYKEEQI